MSKRKRSMLPSAQSLHEIPLEESLCKQPLPFNLYLYIADHYVCYRKRGELLEVENLQRLKSRNVTKAYRDQENDQVIVPPKVDAETPLEFIEAKNSPPLGNQPVDLTPPASSTSLPELQQELVSGSLPTLDPAEIVSAAGSEDDALNVDELFQSLGVDGESGAGTKVTGQLPMLPTLEEAVPTKSPNGDDMLTQMANGMAGLPQLNDEAELVKGKGESEAVKRQRVLIGVVQRLTEMEKKKPKEIKIKIALAKALLDMNRVEDATKLYRKIKTLFPRHSAGYYGLIDVYLRNKWNARALVELDEAEALFGGDPKFAAYASELRGRIQAEETDRKRELQPADQKEIENLQAQRAQQMEDDLKRAFQKKTG